jgi:hypothetical protein
MSAFSINPNKLDESTQKRLEVDWKESMEETQKTMELFDSLAPHF